MNWIWQLALGMISAWIVMSVWFWKLLWHILAVSFEWTCNKVFHGSIQETWRDEEEVNRYIKPAKVRREYMPLEPKAINRNRMRHTFYIQLIKTQNETFSCKIKTTYNLTPGQSTRSNNCQNRGFSI